MSHWHLPSVHVENQDGTGYDYEENLFREKGNKFVRVTTLTVHFPNGPDSTFETTDTLCDAERKELSQNLTWLMQRGNAQAEAFMKMRAEHEVERQKRIAAGAEHRCTVCGCSESRSCSGGCIWITNAICSKCWRPAA